MLIESFFLLIVLSLSHNWKQIYREEQEYEGRINNDERKIMYSNSYIYNTIKNNKKLISLLYSVENAQNRNERREYNLSE